MNESEPDSIFSDLQLAAIRKRQSDRQIYSMVMEEIETTGHDLGIWGQALVITKGDEQKAAAAYIQLRVSAIKDDILEEIIVDEHERTAEAIENSAAREKYLSVGAPFHRYSKEPAYVEWTVELGEQVSAGQVIGKITVKKTGEVLNVKAPSDIILRELLLPSGERVAEYQQPLCLAEPSES